MPFTSRYVFTEQPDCSECGRDDLLRSPATLCAACLRARRAELAEQMRWDTTTKLTPPPEKLLGPDGIA